MRVFLTGGSGFVGSHVARALVAGGHQVRALRRRGSGSQTELPRAVEWIEGDLLDSPSLRGGPTGCEAVVHVAGDVTAMGSPAALAHQRMVNVEGTRNLVEAALAAGVRRLVHTSSTSALGRPAPGTAGDEETPYDWPPGFPYHETKRDGERAALAATSRGLEVVVLNPSLVLGPDDPRRRLARFFRVVQLGFARVAPPGGLTLCDVRRVADAHVAALTLGRSGERYVLGGPNVTFRQFLDLVAAAWRAPAPLFTLPPVVLRLGALPLAALEWLADFQVAGGRLAAFAAERFYSSTKAIAELHYQETPAATLIDDTVEWYRAG